MFASFDVTFHLDPSIFVSKLYLIASSLFLDYLNSGIVSISDRCAPRGPVQFRSSNSFFSFMQLLLIAVKFWYSHEHMSVQT